MNELVSLYSKGREGKKEKEGKLLLLLLLIGTHCEGWVKGLSPAVFKDFVSIKRKKEKDVCGN